MIGHTQAVTVYLLPYKKKRALDIAKKTLHYFFDHEKDLERKKLIKAVTDIFDIEDRKSVV